ncbi:MAG TPA: hypothetical protein VJ044_06490 [Candidatus Hodarchaeales archaeon]|nr:hypothetical protein [Candidatus Hodarchaeales archaeon]
MSGKGLKEFGLDFIEELARERAAAQQETLVTISGVRRAVLNPGSPITYREVDSFVQEVQDRVKRVIDTELNKITIKTLGRLRKVLAGEYGAPDAISSEEGSKLKEQIKLLQEQLTGKTKEESDVLSDMKGELERAKSNLAKLEADLYSVSQEKRNLSIQQSNLQEREKLVTRKLNDALNRIRVNEELLERLKLENKIKDEDIRNALVNVEDVYQANEEYYQQLTVEAVQQGQGAIEREYQEKMADLERLRSEEAARLQEVQKNFQDLQKAYEGGKKDHEAEIRKLQIRLASEVESQRQGTMQLNYTQRLLSTHPLYASILILINLGGSVPLTTLAKSVGVHSLKLRQMLEELVEKHLIVVSDSNPPIVEITDF